MFLEVDKLRAGYGAVEVLHEVASKYTCFLINQILGTLLPTQEGKIYVKGESVNTPCGVALNEGLQPMIARLKERATVQDFTLSKGIFQERVEKAIAELGTMEIRDRKGIGTSKQTKVLGVDVSSTEMEMSAISIPMHHAFAAHRQGRILGLDGVKQIG